MMKFHLLLEASSLSSHTHVDVIVTNHRVLSVTSVRGYVALLRPEAQVFIRTMIVVRAPYRLLIDPAQSHLTERYAHGIVMRTAGNLAALTQQFVGLPGIHDAPSVVLVPPGRIPRVGRGRLGRASDHGIAYLIVLTVGEVRH